MPHSSTTDPAPLIGVTSRLMQNYRVASPVTNSSRIALVPAGPGEVEAFAIGADGHVRNICPDPAADSGWNLADLGTPSPGSVNQVAALRDSTGRTVYALDTSNGLYSISDRRWGRGWQHVPPPVGTSFEEIKAFQDEPGRSFLAALCRISQADAGHADGPAAATRLGFFILGADGWESVQSQLGLGAVTGWAPGIVAQVSADPPAPVWPGVFAAADWNGPYPSQVLALCDAGPQPDVYGRDVDGDYTALIATMGAAGHCEPFAISSDGVLCHLAPHRHRPARTCRSP